MSDVIKLVSGDNLPQVVLTLTDDSTGAALDLSAATTAVSVVFRAAGGTTVLSTITASKVGDGSDGKVAFGFPASTLDVAEGMYEGEVKIDFNGSIQSIYETLRFRVRASFS
jgi:hypothetical protein